MFDFALETELDFLSEAYRRLFEGSQASPFQHPLWLDRLYRDLAPAQGAEPLVLTARHRIDGRLAMVLPMLRRRRHGLRIVEFADLGVSDYTAPVCDEATFDLLAADPATRQEIGRLLRPFDLVRIKKVTDGSPCFERLLPEGRRTPMSISAHATELSSPFEEWRAQNMAHGFVRELQKKRRQIDRMGVFRLERLREPGAIAALLDEIRMFRGKRFPDDVLREDSYFAFYKEVALAGEAEGVTRAYRLSVDGICMGGVWGLSHRSRFLVLISGMDYETYRRQSVGFLAFEDLVRQCIDEGDAVLDFTIGDEQYKNSFGAKPSPLWMVSACGSARGVVASWISSRTELGLSPQALAAASEANAA